MSRAQLHISEAPFALQFGKRGELRQTVGSGRVHLDRWLPFIVLHRSPDPSASIARKVAVNSPAYLIWSAEDDRAAAQTFAAIVAAMHERFGCVLVIGVDDAVWDRFPRALRNCTRSISEPADPAERPRSARSTALRRRSRRSASIFASQLS